MKMCDKLNFPLFVTQKHKNDKLMKGGNCIRRIIREIDETHFAIIESMLRYDKRCNLIETS